MTVLQAAPSLSVVVFIGFRRGGFFLLRLHARDGLVDEPFFPRRLVSDGALVTRVSVFTTAVTFHLMLVKASLHFLVFRRFIFGCRVVIPRLFPQIEKLLVELVIAEYVGCCCNRSRILVVAQHVLIS